MPIWPLAAAMAPTLVAAAVGGLLAAALLGPTFDRRSVVVVVAAAVLPDLDAALSLAVHGATNAALHTLLVPIVAGGLLYWDTEVRDRSAIRDRWGWWGIRVAWVALAAYAVAGIGLDLFGPAGANLLYPVQDRFYVVDGRLLVTTREGLVQTYVGGGAGPLPVASPGTTANHHVASWLNPTGDTGLDAGGAERRLTVVESGWQAVVVAASAAVLAIRSRGWE